MPMDGPRKLSSEDYETCRELWKTLWQAPKDSPIPYIVRADVERDATCPDVQIPKQAWILRLPEEMTYTLKIRCKGLLLRDEIFSATRTIMAKCNPKAPLTLSPEKPSKGLFKDDAPLPETTGCNGIVVIGQPGIGKSAFLRVLLILLIHAKWPVMFQKRADLVVYFSAEGVQVGSVDYVADFARRHTKMGTPKAFALVDSELDITCPDRKYYVNHPPIFIVDTPSPTRTRVAWVSKSPTVQWFVLKPWTLQDVLIARGLQYWERCSEREIAELFPRFQPSPRHAYTENVENYTNQLRRTAPWAVDRFRKVIADAATQYDYDAMWSHPFVTIYPVRHPTTDDDDEGTNADTLVTNMGMDMEVDRTKYELTIPGRGTYDIMAKSLRLSNVTQADQFYKTFTRHAYSKMLTRWLLGDSIHTIFPAGGSWPLRDLKKSSNKGHEKQRYRVGKDKPTACLHISKFGFNITTNAKSNEPTSRLPTYDSLPEVLVSGYYRPPEGHPSFDAFIYDAELATVLVFQASVGQIREVAAGGIEELCKRSDVRHVIYVIVTPPDTDVDIGVAHEADRLMELNKYQITLESVIPQCP